MAMPIMGISLAMEEAASDGEEVDGNAISSVKVALMGPLAGILEIVSSGLHCSQFVQVLVFLYQTGGNILGPLVFLLLFFFVNIGTRYFGLQYGYKFGGDFISKLEGGNIMQRITEGTTLVGLMVLGVMTATMVSVL